jgi:uncharacterized protein
VPITPTYPGVYIEELPSTVHTIVGVSTSVTAFVGYTKRGPADQPTHIFSFGDFQRAFGGLDPDSPLTYAVQQFFLNGGSEAWIVRVAVNADNATVTVQNMAEDTDVLILEASSSGTWANTLRRRLRDDEPGEPLQPHRDGVRRLGRSARAGQLRVVPQPDAE